MKHKTKYFWFITFFAFVGAFAGSAVWQIVKTHNFKPSRWVANADNKLLLDESILGVGSYVAKTADEYYRVRYVLTSVDIYPQIKVEIFTVSGGEGEPITVNVHAVLDALYPTQFAGDAQVEKIEWQNDKLVFQLGKQSCVFDMGTGLSKLGKDFSKANDVKTVCR